MRSAEIVTGKFVEPLLRAVGLPSPSCSEELVIFDNGTGSGIVISTLLGLLSEEEKSKISSITCGDAQEVMVNYVKQRIASDKWANTEAKVIDTQDTKLPSSHFTHVLSSFLLMLVPKPTAALQEIHRILRPGGLNGFSTWKHAGWVDFVKSAVEALPGSPPFPEQSKIMTFMGTGAWDDGEFIKAQCEQYGFEQVQVHVQRELPTMDSPEWFVGMFWNMFSGVAMKWWTDEEKKEWGPKVKDELLRQLQERHGKGKPFEMEMVANIVTCRKPVA